MSILKGGGRQIPLRAGGGPTFWTAGILIIAGAFWISGGHALFGRNASAQPAAGPKVLRIANVVSRIERHGGRAVLIVDGEVANGGAARASLSGLMISVAGSAGRTTHYVAGTGAGPIEPGRRLAFSSRLEAPPGGVEAVTVDFGGEGGS